LNSSIARWSWLPTPGVPYDRLVSLAFAIKSGMILTPSLGAATITFAAVARMVMGAKSRSTSNVTSGIKVGLMVRLPAGITSKVVPSGVERRTASMPMFPAPPVRFSTLAACPDRD
jgi:hypothetical protein